MANVKRGLWRLYIVLASALSGITILVTMNALQTLSRQAQTATGFFDTEITWVALFTLLIIWGAPLLGFYAVRWIIQGFRSRG